MAIGTPRDERRAREIERTRQDIIRAAAHVFSQGGFHAATMAAIAREAGFTAASLYTYFASKDAIYQALSEDMQQRILAVYELPVPSGLTFAQQLELLLQRQLRLLSEHLDALRVFLDTPLPRAQGRDVRAAFRERSTRFLAEVGAGELRVPPHEAADALFGLAYARVFAWLVGDEQPDPSHLASRIVDLFLRGAARSEPSRIQAEPDSTAGESQ